MKVDERKKWNEKKFLGSIPGKTFSHFVTSRLCEKLVEMEQKKKFYYIVSKKLILIINEMEKFKSSNWVFYFYADSIIFPLSTGPNTFWLLIMVILFNVIWYEISDSSSRCDDIGIFSAEERVCYFICKLEMFLKGKKRKLGCVQRKWDEVALRVLQSVKRFQSYNSNKIQFYTLNDNDDDMKTVETSRSSSSASLSIVLSDWGYENWMRGRFTMAFSPKVENLPFISWIIPST